MAILDLRLMNLDRNGENIMVRSVDDGTGGRRLQLIPIDHGSCFPSDLGVSAFVRDRGMCFVRLLSALPCAPCRTGFGSTGRN